MLEGLSTFLGGDIQPQHDLFFGSCLPSSPPLPKHHTATPVARPSPANMVIIESIMMTGSSPGDVPHGIPPASNFRPSYLVPASEVRPHQPIFITEEDTTVYKPAPLADTNSKLMFGCCHEQQPRENEPQVSTTPNPIQPPRAANQGPHLEAPVPPIPYTLSNVYHVSPLTPPQRISMA
jgi:hypothetical protein